MGTRQGRSCNQAILCHRSKCNTPRGGRCEKSPALSQGPPWGEPSPEQCLGCRTAGQPGPQQPRSWTALRSRQP